MRSKAGADRLRRRAVRDLIAAAVLIVVALAYFIPEISANVQDLTLARRKNSYKMETVRFASESVLLAERLRTVRSFEEGQTDFLQLQSGQKMDRETAEKTALEEAGKLLDTAESEEIRKLFSFYQDEFENGRWAADSAAGMAVSIYTREPFIVWVCSFSFEDGFDLLVILDESSGKALHMSINIWNADSFAGWNWEEEAPALAAGLSDYYGMTGSGYECYMEEPFLLGVEMASEGETVRIPVIATEYAFAVNHLEINDFMNMYGLPAEFFDDGGIVSEAEEEEPEAENWQGDEAVDEGKKG